MTMLLWVIDNVTSDEMILSHLAGNAQDASRKDNTNMFSVEQGTHTKGNILVRIGGSSTITWIN